MSHQYRVFATFLRNRSSGFEQYINFVCPLVVMYVRFADNPIANAFRAHTNYTSISKKHTYLTQTGNFSWHSLQNSAINIWGHNAAPRRPKLFAKRAYHLPGATISEKLGSKNFATHTHESLLPPISCKQYIYVHILVGWLRMCP